MSFKTVAGGFNGAFWWCGPLSEDQEILKQIYQNYLVAFNGKLDFNGNFHRILDADWLWCLVAMVVTIESKVTINGKFYATGPWCLEIGHLYYL